MVNTFVPFADIQACAKALDYRRLGKQRVEAYQLWRALQGITKGWVNHPATLMWKGHTCFLAKYMNTMIDEWVARGYRNTMKKLPHCANPRPPWWWGWAPIHKSHQAALNRKKPDFYTFDAGSWMEWGYVWPSKVQFQYRIRDPEPSQVCEILVVSSPSEPKRRVNQPKQTMATSVRFAALTVTRGPADRCALEPAPSVKDWDHITAGLEWVEPISGVDALFAGDHIIRGDYRSWTMWLYPNVRFYRDDPKTEGGQGMAGWPSPGMQENVTLRIDGEKYAAVVEFV